MTRRATYAPSLFSVETTRTAPPPYETSSLFNAEAPASIQCRDPAFALESPQPSVLASSSIHDEELRASSSQCVEEVTTPPAQPELERHESNMGWYRSEPTKSAFRSPNPLRLLKSLRRLEVPSDEGPVTRSAPPRPVTVVTPTPATPLASEHSLATFHEPRSRGTASRSTNHDTEGSEPFRRKRMNALYQPLPQSGSGTRSLPSTMREGTLFLPSTMRQGTRSLPSTMRQVLANHRKYVAPFGIYTTSRLIPP